MSMCSTAQQNMHQGDNMKDVKVDVRVNVGVDSASVILLLASAAAALFFYKQNKQDKLASSAAQDAAGEAQRLT
jgi:hypothetical protein